MKAWLLPLLAVLALVAAPTAPAAEPLASVKGATGALYLDPCPPEIQFVCDAAPCQLVFDDLPGGLIEWARNCVYIP